MLLFLLASLSLAQDAVPERKIPATVLNEVRLLETRFDAALSADCDPSRCFPKGCTYVDHEVADRPRATSLPGLGEEPAPRAEDAQSYLTAASCAFAYEDNVSPRDAGAVARRLQSKLSGGWTVVTVTTQRLSPLPDAIDEPYTPEEDTDVPDTDVPVVEEAPAPPPPPWSLATAAYELWTTLLPHFFWMIAVFMVSVAAIVLIWAWRRVGRASIEEQMLLAELSRGDGAPSEEGAVVAVEYDEDAAFVEDQRAIWHERLAPSETPDLEVQALIRDRLRAGDLPFLAKAALTFPDSFPAAFPAGAVGGELAAAKLALADYLQQVDGEALPDDADFFRALNRHALAAAVASQSDARTVRILREDFGTTGLAGLLDRLPARSAALLFALAPMGTQVELVRLLTPDALGEMAGMLLRSNRISADENDHLSQVLVAARDGQPIPHDPSADQVSDQGEAFDASGALSILLDGVSPDRRAALFSEVIERLHGSLPAWTRSILSADMLLALTTESRADLLLGIDTLPLSAWLSLLDPEARSSVLAGMPNALSASVQASSVFPDRARQLGLAAEGRRAVSEAFLSQLARMGVPFEQVVVRPG